MEVVPDVIMLGAQALPAAVGGPGGLSKLGTSCPTCKPSTRAVGQQGRSSPGRAVGWIHLQKAKRAMVKRCHKSPSPSPPGPGLPVLLGDSR